MTNSANWYIERIGNFKEDKTVMSAQSEKHFEVSGDVLQSDGRNLEAPVVVRAHDQGLRSRSFLGEAKIDATGRYTIRYPRTHLLNPRKGSGNLVVEAIGSEDQLLATSEIRFNARRQENVRLKIDTAAGRSEWDRVSNSLFSALEGVPLRDVTDADFPFLIKSSGLLPDQLRLRVQASRTAALSGLPDWFHYAVSRQGLPVDLEALADLPIARVKEAIAAAQKSRVVDSLTDKEVATLWSHLEGIQRKQALEEPIPGRTLKFAQILGAAGLDESTQCVLSRALAGTDLADPVTWTAVQTQTGLDDADVARARLAFGSMTLADGDMGVIAAVLKDTRVKSMRDLARYYGVDEWRSLVEKALATDDADPSASAQRSNLATQMFARVAEAYPNEAVIYDLPRNEKLASRPAVALLPSVLAADPDFDLANVRIDAYLREKKGNLALADEKQEAAARDDLRRVQRVYRLRAEPRAVAQLLENGLDSSFAIVSSGKKAFIEKYGPLLGTDVVRNIFDRAQATAARVLGVLTRFSPIVNANPVLAAVAPCPAQLKGTPNYSSLFGSLDGCECCGCESVYGPAAYLADLLAFVERETAAAAGALVAGGLGGLKIRSFCDHNGGLKSRKPRRPDILDVRLSCRNAETLLPYVDLVLEILEHAISPNPGPENTPQTTLTADELAAQPEHVIPAAYDVLSRAVFPFSLPFDLPAEEAAIYLGAMGASRVGLLEVFFPFGGVDQPRDMDQIRRWQDAPIAAARLGLTANQWKLIADQPVVPVVFAAQTWGFDPIAGADWWRPLEVVDTFLKRTGLEYKDLLRLLTLKSFNPDGGIKLKPDDLNNCDPLKITILQLSSRALLYLHRFLRLQCLLKLSLQEMDQAVVALGTRPAPGAIDQDFLIRLSHLVQLRGDFSLPLVELLSWWGPLDTSDYNAPSLPTSRSFYEELFLSGRPGEAQYESFLLNSSRDELEDPTQPLAQPVALAALAAALRLGAADVQLLTNALVQPDSKLTLANISLLFRHSSLARALRLSIADYLAAKTLIGFDPFTDGTGADKTIQTLRFVARVQAVQSTAFSLAELDYVLRQTEPYASGQTAAPTDSWVAAAVASLRSAIEPLADSGGPREEIKQARAMLASSGGATSDQLRPLIQAAVDEASRGSDSDLLAVLQTALTLVAPGLALDAEAVSVKLSAADAILQDSLIQGLATALADLLEIPIVIAADLLNNVLSPAGDSESTGTVLLRAFAPAGAAPPTDAELGRIVRRLHKTALVVLKLGITDSDLTGLLPKSASAGWLNLTALPVEGVVNPPAFEAWLRLAALLQFRSCLVPEQQEHCFELFEIADEFDPSGDIPSARQAYIDKLVQLTGWNPDEVTALVGRLDPATLSDSGGGILQPRFPKQFQDERLPYRVWTAITMLRQFGGRAFDVQGWISTPPNAQQVERIKQALKARLGDRWSTDAKRLRDPLRERQRRSLQAYLLQEWNLQQADDLSDHFLIDVEMRPCMMTSRLIQATGSVQLFVQRVLMNLEPGLSLTEEGAEQWEWMKNYRVWEANRKIFLYPEDWIDPELRDDRTPFFKDLQNELSQADIDNDSAETALAHYLEQLYEIARPQVCGQYLESGNPSILHVFARTRDVPHHYYYRRGEVRVDQTTTLAGASWEGALDADWRPWERLDLDIEGDHLIPVVYNRRLYLFWPIFSSEDEAPLTHTLQELLTGYAQLFQLLMSLGKLIKDLFQETGAALAGGTTNSVLQVLSGIEGSINSLVPGIQSLAPGLTTVDLSDMENRVRDVRNALVQIFGVPPPSSDDTQAMLNQANLVPFQDLTDIFNDVVAFWQDYQSYLISFLPARRLEVQLAWSECKNDSWSAKRTSSGVVAFHDVISILFESLPDLPGLARKGVRRLFTFHAEQNAANQLTVHCDVALPTSLLDPSTYNSGQWLTDPKEIGYFRLNSCSGRLEATDSGESLGLLDLFTQAVSQVLTVANATLSNLQGDRQLQQQGEPVTPDDDPNRPSRFRNRFETGEWPRLPHHFVAGEGEDVYRLLTRHQDVSDLSKLFGFFYQDGSRTFFCFPWALPKNNPGKHKDPFGYIFIPFYHPYTCSFLANLQRFGIPGLYDIRFDRVSDGPLNEAADGQPLQLLLRNDTFLAPPEYDPADNVYNPPDGPRALRPVEEVSFSAVAAYSQYNWEIFFHIPFLMATRLSANQKFSESQRWFHYIFNPTDASNGDAPAKYWRTRPFVETAAQDYEQQQIDQLLQTLNSEAATPGLQELEWAVRQWRQDAFNPFLVARTRSVAFQKAVVLKYIDNLIAWGDYLFRQETRETINEATQLYTLAAKLLGPRPRRIPKASDRLEYSYTELTANRPLDAFSNAFVEIESFLTGPGGEPYASSAAFVSANHGPLDRVTMAPVSNAWRTLTMSRTLMDVIGHKGGWNIPGRQTASAPYFCVPPDTKLLEKWDTVADRLFKIRHCQNIDGQVVALPLLGPPIDPAILVQARANGVDIDALLSQLHARLPPYRFQALAQKATEVCSEVKALGSALLSALEKRDGEALAVLRNTHETRVLEAVNTLKESQIQEARQTLEGLRRSQEATVLRRDYYQLLLTEFMNPEEIASAALGAGSLMIQIGQIGASWGASSASLIPNIKAGFVTTLGTTYGGQNISGAAENAASAIGSLASIMTSTAGLISTMGGYLRRGEEWAFQVRVANKELEGFDQQIAAAETRLSIAQFDSDSHKLQIQNSKEDADFLQQKFTSQELYEWLVAQTSSLYFQTYQLAYDLAKKSENAFAFEIGGDSPGIIRPGYWDSFKKGLLSGEQLHYDLKRLEVAYMESNSREYELTKNVSLCCIDPVQLMALRETGTASFTLPESLFDMDFPGQYFRRIKSVGLTIPCVVGPYASISATLRLVSSCIRSSIDLTGGYVSAGPDDARFTVNHAATRSVATSAAQNDHGLFEFNFRDERYLPFEGEGAESKWELSLNKDFAQFDYGTITDVILHVRYTAREGNGSLRSGAVSTLQALIASAEASGSVRLFSARHDFPNDWARFQNSPSTGAERAELTFKLRPEHYPFWSQGRLRSVSSAAVFARSRAADPPDSLDVYDAADPAGPSHKVTLTRNSAMGNVLSGELSNDPSNIPLPASPIGETKLYFTERALDDVWFSVAWSSS